jgi:hypothetical protein
VVRAFRVAGWLLGGLIALTVGVTVVVLGLSYTRVGMEQARRQALEWLAGRTDGTIRVGRIDGPGLLRGLVLHDVAIDDGAGRPFARADSIAVSYRLRALLRGRVVLDDLVVWGAVVAIERLPGEPRWNAERIFDPAPQPAAEPDGGVARPIVFRGVRLVDAEVTIRQPAAEERAGPGTRFVIEQTPTGAVEVYRFEDVQLDVSRLVLRAPGDRSLQAEVRAMSGTVRILADPFRVRSLEGSVSLADSTLSFDARAVELRASRLGASGRVVLGSAGTRYDIEIDGRRIDPRDLDWLFPDVLPDGGEATLALTVRTEGAGVLLSARDIRAAAGVSRVSGSAGVWLGPVMELRGVDLRLAPLDLALLTPFARGTTLPEGRLAGTVAADGPPGRLRSRGLVQLLSATGRPPSRFEWRGTFETGAAPGVRQLTARVEALDLAWFATLFPDRVLAGRLDLGVEADGRLDTGLAFRGTAVHEAAAGISIVAGGGTVRVEDGGAVLDVELRVDPVALASLSAFAPELGPLRGEARGTLALRGTAADLGVDARLETSGGGIDVDGRARLAGEPGFRGRVAVRALEPARLWVGLPDIAVGGTADVALRGAGPATLTGDYAVVLDSLRLERVGLGRSVLSGRVDSGVALIDSFVVVAPGFEARGVGAFGLVAGRAGTLRLDVRSESLEPLEAFVFAEPNPDPTSPRLAGRAHGEIRLHGSVAELAVDGDLVVDELVHGDRRIEGGRIHVDARGIGTGRLDGRVAVEADSVAVLGRRLSDARLDVVVRGDTAAATFAVRQAGRDALAAKATGIRGDAAGRVTLHHLVVGADRAAWALAEPLAVEVAAGLARIGDLELARADGRGRVRAGGVLAWQDAATAEPPERLDFTAELEGVAVDELRRALLVGPAAEGVVDGRVRITGVPLAPSIEAEIAARGVRVEDAHIQRFEARARYAQTRLDIDVEAFQDARRVLRGEGRVPVDLRFRRTDERRLAQQLDFSVQFDSLPAVLALGAIDAFRGVEGVIDGAVNARGTTRDPELSGALALRRGGATLEDLGVRYRDAVGTFLFERNMVVNVDLSARTADTRGRPGGSVRVTGEVDLARPSDPDLRLRVLADRMLAARRRDVDLLASGSIDVGGRYTRPTIGGEIRIDGGTVNLDELYRQYLIVGLEDPRVFDVVDTTLVSVRRVLPPSENPFIRNLRIEDAAVVVGPGTWLRSREMNVEVAGELNLTFDRIREDDLRVLGTLRVVRGTYRMDYPPFARVFEVREGSVDFPGTPGFNPGLSITASHRARSRGEPLDILAVVSGTLESPRVRLTSDAEPPISESDLASYLFFGAPTYAFNLGAGTLGAGRGDGVFGSLFAASGLGYVASGLQTLAQSLGIVDYVGLTAAEAAPGETGILAATQIELGRYLTPQLFVAWTQRLDTGTQPGIRLEWRVDRLHTVEAFVEDRYARLRTPSLRDATAARRVYGLSVFREWGY